MITKILRFFAKLVSIIGALLGGAIATYFLTVALGWVSPDFENPLQTAMIVKQAAELHLPFAGPGLPKPGHIRVLVTYIHGDNDGLYSNRLYNVIHREPLFETILVYRPLHIPKSGTYPETKIQAQNAAAKLAEQWNADIVVYGERDIGEGTIDLSIFSRLASHATDLTPYAFDMKSFRLPSRLIEPLGSAVVAKIYANPIMARRSEPHKLQEIVSTTKQLEGIISSPSEIVNPQLKNALRLTLSELYVAIADAKENPEWLKKMITVNQAILHDARNLRRGSTTEGAANLFLGIALARLGYWQNDTNRFPEAFMAFERALDIFSSSKATTHSWAITEYQFGLALANLAELKGDAALLNRALSTYDSAWDVLSREKPTVRIPALHRDVGITLIGLNESNGDTKLLDRAVSELRVAVKEFWSEGDVVDAVNAMIPLGTALSNLGYQTANAEMTKQAIAEFQKVLAKVTRTDSPEFWANTQYRLGVAQARLGEQAHDVGILRKAVGSFSECLSVYTNDKSKIRWADAKYQLGLVQTNLGEFSNDINSYVLAVNAIAEALKGLSQDDKTYRNEMEYRLGTALFGLGCRKNDASLVSQAKDIFVEAARIHPRDKEPADWADAEIALAGALACLGRQNQDASLVMQAIKTYQAALEIYTKETSPLVWAQIHNDIGRAYDILAKGTGNLTLATAAIREYEDALTVATPTNGKAVWQDAKVNLSRVLAFLGIRKGDGDILRQAIATSQTLLKEINPKSEPGMWIEAQSSLASALRYLGEMRNDATLLQQSADVYALVHSNVEIAVVRNDLAQLRAGQHLQVGQPTCTLRVSPPSLKYVGDVMLYWNSTGATEGHVEDEDDGVPLPGGAGNMPITGITATSTYNATFTNSDSGKSVHCSATVTVTTR